MISVIIRTKNECNNLAICLDRLVKQTIKSEIVVVDSHSNDDTVSISESFRCKVIQSDNFTFGKGLNDGIRASNGDYIAILSGHCFPTQSSYLQKLQENFKLNIAGVYARQIPHKETNPLEYRNFVYTYKSEPILQKKCSFFNNAASMIKREIWEDVPFDEKVSVQEDIVWAKEVQSLGYYIAYEPEAIVEHLHNENIEKTVDRYIKEYQVIKEVMNF